MKVYRRTWPRLAALLLIVCIAACDSADGSDSRTKRVTPGITRDSALALLEARSGGDSVRHIYRSMRYFMHGQYLEVLWYSRRNERWTAADTVPEKKPYPIVLIEDKVVGKGRALYDSLAALGKLPVNRY